ncbi:AMIN-like domain-containing (lipo)protein [Promicromonospora sp. Marseille-Q5078]
MTSTRTRPAAGALAAALLVVALAGCADNGPEVDGPGSAPSDSPGDTATASSAPDDGTDDTAPDDTSADEPTQDVPFPADASPDTADPSRDAALVVTDVRVGTHEGFDRVVLDLEGEGAPGWTVEYVDAATDDGSGDPVAVDGDRVLQVRLSGMAMPGETDGGPTEYDGGPIDPDGTESIDEVVYRFWFEGYTTAFVGVDDGAGGEPLPFRVFALEDPARVVVDVQHDPADD